MSYDLQLPDDPLAEARFMRDLERYTARPGLPLPTPAELVEGGFCPVCGLEAPDSETGCLASQMRAACPRRVQ